MIALLWLVHSPRDVYVYALIPAGTSILMTAAVYVILVKRAKVQFQLPSLKEARKALIASLPLGGTMALVIVFHYANNLIVQAYLGMTALGIFWAAYRLIDLATQIPGLLVTVFLPRLTRFAGSDPALARREALLYARVHMIIGFFIAAYAFAEAPAIIAILYGVKVRGGGSIAPHHGHRYNFPFRHLRLYELLGCLREGLGDAPCSHRLHDNFNRGRTNISSPIGDPGRRSGGSQH